MKRFLLPRGELVVMPSPSALPIALRLGTGNGVAVVMVRRHAEERWTCSQVIADELTELLDLPGPSDRSRQAAVLAWLRDSLPEGALRSELLYTADLPDGPTLTNEQTQQALAMLERKMAERNGGGA